jgi:hypothetical protein
MAQWDQAQCINEAFKKVMTFADANFVGSTRVGLATPACSDEQELRRRLQEGI